MTFSAVLDTMIATLTKDLPHSRRLPATAMCSCIRSGATFCLIIAVVQFSKVGLCAVAITFSNANVIALNDGLDPPTRATPYPSSITVAGLAGQVVTKATVTLFGFTHEFPSDVDILLVGPQGQKSIVMANAGGQKKYSVTNLVLTLDDDAASTLPIYTRLVSGTFKPTDGYAALGYPNLPFDFPSPAPAGNSNSPTALSVFKNTDPSGTWKLFVVDDVSGDTGSIDGGWSLTLSVAVPLLIGRIQTNIVVSWPTSATNCSLQSSAGLSTLWGDVTNAPASNGGRYYVTNSITGGSRFYRLIQHLP